MLCLCAMSGMLAGCSRQEAKDSNTGSEINKSAQRAVENTKDAKDKASNRIDDNIDNIMTYFKDQGIAYENMQSIEDMEFAAYEGRSFMMGGKNVYLYRVKTDDSNMKKVLKEAKDKGKVKVRINNKEEEYGAQVNGSYLLLFDTNADTADLQKQFPKYQSTGVHSSDPNADMNAKDTTQSEKNITDEATD